MCVREHTKLYSWLEHAHQRAGKAWLHKQRGQTDHSGIFSVQQHKCACKPTNMQERKKWGSYQQQLHTHTHKCQSRRSSYLISLPVRECGYSFHHGCCSAASVPVDKVSDESESNGLVLRLHYNPHIIHACVTMQRMSLRLGDLGPELHVHVLSNRTQVQQMSNLLKCPFS